MRRARVPGRLRPRRRAHRRRGGRANARGAGGHGHLRHAQLARQASPNSSARGEAGRSTIVIGTQLVTKGYHFPKLTLVGVVDADLGLEGGDLRAAERTFQQILQVSGRAGRGAKPGEVLIQTRHPEAAVIAALAAGDRDAFYAAETEARRDAGAPPFGRWAAIIVSSEDEAEARAAASATPIRKSKAWRCSARPRRRWRCCAAAIATGC